MLWPSGNATFTTTDQKDYPLECPRTRETNQESGLSVGFAGTHPLPHTKNHKSKPTPCHTRKVKPFAPPIPTLFKGRFFCARFDMFYILRAVLCVSMVCISSIYMLSERNRLSIFGSYLLDLLNLFRSRSISTLNTSTNGSTPRDQTSGEKPLRILTRRPTGGVQLHSPMSVP